MVLNFFVVWNFGMFYRKCFFLINPDIRFICRPVTRNKGNQNSIIIIYVHFLIMVNFYLKSCMTIHRYSYTHVHILYYFGMKTHCSLTWWFFITLLFVDFACNVFSFRLYVSFLFHFSIEYKQFAVG